MFELFSSLPGKQRWWTESRTLSAVSWPPAGALSWASGFDSLCEEGAVALGPATSLSLASVLDLLLSTLESPSAPVSFGRLGDACQKGLWKRQRQTARQWADHEALGVQLTGWMLTSVDSSAFRLVPPLSFFSSMTRAPSSSSLLPSASAFSELPVSPAPSDALSFFDD